MWWKYPAIATIILWPATFGINFLLGSPEYEGLIGAIDMALTVGMFAFEGLRAAEGGGRR